MNGMTSNVLTAVVTAVILGVLGFFMGVFERGATAMSEDQIEAVIKKVMVMDNGDTYAQALVKSNEILIRLDTNVKALMLDVGDLEASVLDLAGGG